MKSQDALATLRQNEQALRDRGVRHAALFGSLARSAGRPDSDIDILVELDPDTRMTIYDYVGLKNYIASLFDVQVDVVDREALKPHLRQSSAQDALYAF
jgi:predicted nucleotidyltransferase